MEAWGGEPGPGAGPSVERRIRKAALRRRRRRVAVATIVAVGLVVGIGAWSLRSGGGSPPEPAAASAGAPAGSTDAITSGPRLTRMRLVARPAGSLPAPLQDAAASASATGAMILLGGLTAADASTGEIVRVGPAGARRVGALRTAVHDATAVTLPGGIFLFGGGDGIGQHAEIARVDQARGCRDRGIPRRRR